MGRPGRSIPARLRARGNRDIPRSKATPRTGRAGNFANMGRGRHLRMAAQFHAWLSADLAIESVSGRGDAGTHQRPLRPHSSSASRFTAGAAGFLNLSQSRVRSLTYGEPRRASVKLISALAPCQQPTRRALFDKRPQSFLSVIGCGDLAEILHRITNAAPVIEIIGTDESSAPQPHRSPRLRRKHTGHCPRFVRHLLVWHDPAYEAAESRSTAL